MFFLYLLSFTFVLFLSLVLAMGRVASTRGMEYGKWGETVGQGRGVVDGWAASEWLCARVVI